MINTYDGEPRGVFGPYFLTYSTWRPKGFEWEASRQDGDASVFASTLDDLLDELRERIL